MTLQEALEREARYSEPTPEDLGLPSDVGHLYRIESTLEAPRSAWRAYYAAIGGAAAEAEERKRRRPTKKRGVR